ncbi:tachykinin-like peptides receptor 99D [Belonocnema kinseyi]|uniref:tachykinin-like peptides receptor 99D n=1 Tax=Belonocnema kinseyi TaxID=2817044 RepID=UPI00143D6A21|nr:tachykinin-like peptides receptor 99D [Belonocnema kinseyi]
MILTYFLPIGSMTYTYARVGLELWGSQSIGEATQRQLDNIKSKRRVVKMMIVVVVIFAVCWLPFHVYFILTSYVPEITTGPYVQEIYLAIYWLAMSNSMYNPIIYCWMNSRFRRGFAQFFHWCPWVHVTPEPTLSRSEAVTSRYSCAGSPDGHTRISRNGMSCSSLDRPCTTTSTTPRSESCLELDVLLEENREIEQREIIVTQLDSNTDDPDFPIICTRTALVEPAPSSPNTTTTLS